METEQQLTINVQHGNRRSQRELYDRFAPLATALARRYVADDEAVKDVLQDGFVKVFTTIDRFQYRGEGSLKAWVMRIVVNRAINYLRDEGRLRFTESLPDLADVPDEQPDVGPVSSEKLAELIARLPDGYRTVLNLFVFEQRSHKEIAHMLGIKESTSASQYLRAKKMLAKEIKAYTQNI